MLQNWAVRFIGTNATILRAETIDRPQSSSIGFFGYEWGFWNVNEGDDTSSDGYYTCDPSSEADDRNQGCSVFGLLPRTKGDTGVFMHPPREFDFRNQRGKQMRTVITDTTNNDEQLTVYTDMHSATRVNLTLGATEDTTTARAEDRVIVSPVQETLNEKMLEKVYFLPVSYPDGGRFFQGPRLMDKELFIDVNSLSSSLNTELSSLQAAQARTGVWTRENPSASPAGEVMFPSDWIRLPEMTWYTYALQRTENGANCSGLQSYCNYREAGYEYLDDIDTSAEEQQIYRRYVGVFYNQNHTGQQFITQSPPLSAASDPFRAPCVESDEDRSHMWFAVGMDFNKDGEFLGYISRFCGSHNGESGIQMAVAATLKDQCVGFASVYDRSAETDPDRPSNKAWTDRVWPYAQNNSFDLGGIGPGIGLQQQAQPYGTLRDLTSNDVEKNAGLRDYIFSDVEAGIPLSCPLRVSGLGGFTATDIMINSFACSALSAEQSGYSYGYDSAITEHIATGRPSTELARTSITNNLFAKIFQWKRFGNIDINYSSYNELRVPNILVTDNDFLDDSEDTRTELAPPRIHGLNPATCNAQTGEITQGCTAAERHTISINGVTGLNTDYDGDGVVITDGEDLYGFGRYFATARFFAFADDNRMPIRSVIMDWQAENGRNSVISSAGRYKNRKPYCSTNDDASGVGECLLASGEDTGVTCEADAQCSVLGSGASCNKENNSFGNAPRACIDGYFEYSYTYTCTDAEYALNGSFTVDDIDNTELQQRLISLHSLSLDTPVCIYQPRVQVKDNWGYCNASGSFENEQFGLQDLTDQSDGVDLCATDFDAPWTYFDQEIVIVKTE
jgi:hypothetical protein